MSPLLLLLLQLLSLSPLLQASTLAVASSSSISADTGNWTVGDCILAQFKMQLIVDLGNRTELNSTQTWSVPKSAEADTGEDNCRNPQEQRLFLQWMEVSSNGTELHRNVTFEFLKVNETNVSPKYGIRRIFGSLELAHFTSVDAKNASFNVTSYINFDTLERNPVMMPVPVNKSYLCADVGEIKADAHLKFSYPGWPEEGTLLANATKVLAKDVQLDAFRAKDAPKQGFQVPMDCDYEPNDIVPIAVGVALAALVVIVLVAYMIGRRKRRQRGYQSV